MARITFNDITPDESPTLTAIARDHGVLIGRYNPGRHCFTMLGRAPQIRDVVDRLHLTFIPYPAVA